MFDTFADIVKQARLDRGWHQTMVAVGLDCSVPYVSDVERGKRTPALHKAPLWAKSLGIDMKELVRAILQERLDDAGLDYVVKIKE